jgi:plastocyanin
MARRHPKTFGHHQDHGIPGGDQAGRRGGARTSLVAIVSTLAAVALATAGCTMPTTKDGKGYGPSDEVARAAPPAKPPVTLRSGARAKLSSHNYTWNPGAYVAAPGAAIVLDVVNDDTSQHNFTFGDLGVSQNIPVDGHKLIRFKAPDPGKYRFYCKYHGQEMQGWLTVKQ